MAGRVLIAGVSTRAAAESAAKAGFEVTAVDAFGDLDQHPAVRSVSLPRDPAFTAQAAADAARGIEADGAAYLSPFENHSRAVESLAERRMLWGNAPDVLHRVRDPFLLAGSLRRQGFTTPVTRVDVPPDLAATKEWLVKPFRSGGGHGVRRWVAGERVAAGHYAQEHISGVPASVVFVAAGGRAVVLGLSRQIIGDDAFGASGFRYCGNLLTSSDDEILTDRVAGVATELATRVSETFGLVGVNGIDCIVQDGRVYVIEVNPRWCSSMELVERHYGLSVFGAHAAACVDRALPDFDLPRTRRSRSVIGKAIVFAREDITMGDTRAWLADTNIRDVPKPGEHISAGLPICTIFAEAVDAQQCHVELQHRARILLEK